MLFVVRCSLLSVVCCALLFFFPCDAFDACRLILLVGVSVDYCGLFVVCCCLLHVDCCSLLLVVGRCVLLLVVDCCR